MTETALRLKSTAQSVCELEGFLQRLMHKVEIPTNRYPEILISLTEAVNNAIIHGNKNDERKNVVVKFSLKEHQLAFTVKDEGPGFDPSMVPDPTTIEKIDCCGGRGVYIMTQLCDKINYRRNGSIVEMYFNK